MKCGSYIAALFLLTLLPLAAQEFNTKEYQLRDSLINRFMQLEDYEKASAHIETQVQYLRETGRYDSLYHYTYPRGRAWWKNTNREEGISRLLELKAIIFEIDPDTTHLLDVLNDLSWIYYETGLMKEYFDTDHAVLALTRKYSKALPTHYYTAYYNLGFDYMETGNSREAAAYFDKSVEPLREDSLAQIDRNADGYNAIGAARYRTGEFHLAKKAFRKALFYTGKLKDSLQRHAHTANIYGNLSLMEQDEYNMVKARAHLEKAIEYRKKALELAPEAYLKDRERDHLMGNYKALASIYLELGEYAKAEKITRYVKQQREAYLEPGDPRLKLQDESLGSIFLARGDYDQALSYCNRYLEACLVGHGRESFLTGKAYKRVAQILVAQQNWAAARKNYDEAISTFALIEDEQQGRELALSHLERSEVYVKLGQKEKALRDAEKAHFMLKTSRLSYDPVIGRSLLQLALIHYHFNENDLALQSTEQAIRLLKENQKQLSKREGGSLNSYTRFLPEAYLLQSKIFMASYPGQPDLLEEALEPLQKALALIRNQRHIFIADEAQLLYSENQLPIYKEAQKVYLNLYQNTGNPTHLEQIFLLQEESHSLLLRRQLNQFRSLRFAGLPDSLQQREQRLLHVLNRQLPSDTSFGSLLKYEKEYDQLRSLWREKYPQYYALRYSDSLADWKAVRKHWLDPSGTWLQFVFVEDKLLALLITDKNEELVILDTVRLRKNVQNFNEAIAQNDASACTQYSRVLFTQLIAPLSQHLQGDQLYIVPDGILYRLNFESLRSDKGQGPATYLVNQYAISYLPSATAALQFRELRSGGSASVLAFAPGFTDEQKHSYARKWGDSLVLAQGFSQRLQQPFAVRTAQGLGSVFRAQVYLHHRATEKRFRTEAGNHHIIHLGTHTELNENSPLYSRLVLSWPEGTMSEDDDGFLHAYEIYNMRLRAELAVLTACETGRGRYSSSEGAMSLAHSFAYAGCPSVVMSLWQIDEKTSAEILERFYHHLKDGMPKNRALQQAKIDFLNNSPEELHQPYYWAGMVLLGDHQPISRLSPGSPWYWWAGAGTLLLLGVFLLSYYRRVPRRV